MTTVIISMENPINTYHFSLYFRIHHIIGYWIIQVIIIEIYFIIDYCYINAIIDDGLETIVTIIVIIANISQFTTINLDDISIIDL